MLRPALQLRLGQQLTMTPQLQQAIRLLQLPALELQQTVREALEQNVMLEAAASESEADAAEDAWDEGPSAASSDTPWSGDDRAQDFSDDRGETLQEHL